MRSKQMFFHTQQIPSLDLNQPPSLQNPNDDFKQIHTSTCKSLGTEYENNICCNRNSGGSVKY